VLGAPIIDVRRGRGRPSKTRFASVRRSEVVSTECCAETRQRGEALGATVPARQTGRKGGVGAWIWPTGADDLGDRRMDQISMRAARLGGKGPTFLSGRNRSEREARQRIKGLIQFKLIRDDTIHIHS